MTACGGGTDIGDFEDYGQGMPGSGLDEGGEVLMERIFISPTIAGDPDGQPAEFNAFHAFQYSGAFTGALDAPAPGTCFKFTHPTSFPVHDIPATAEYVDWGATVSLAGPGVPGGSIDIDKVVAPTGGLTDGRPSPVRNHKEGNFIYGGPTWQMDNFQNVTLQEGEYSLDINAGDPLTFNFPPSYDFPLNAGVADITLPASSGDGITISYGAIPNPNTAHSRTHTFAFIAFAAFPGSGDLGPTPMYLCQPPNLEDGEMVIPQAVIDDIPDAGIFQTGRLTHFMEEIDGRRFDMFSIYCAISAYAK